MFGLIWFIQIVHYPLFARVGAAGFAEYERLHQSSTGWVVGPPMLLEAATTVALLWSRPAGVPLAGAVMGALALAAIWASTAFLQVPPHRALERGFDAVAHRFLVRSNWIRTALWSFRLCLVAFWTATNLTP